MTIHTGDPFADPPERRSLARRLRGRLPSAVTLWTALDPERGPAGLTVSSTVVIDGAPGRLLGVIDPESSLWEAAERSGRFTVAPLRVGDGRVADIFAGLMPAPGGPFSQYEWRTTEYGPVLPALTTWAGCLVVEARPIGWGPVLVEAILEEVQIAENNENSALVTYRGRYQV